MENQQTSGGMHRRMEAPMTLVPGVGIRSPLAYMLFVGAGLVFEDHLCDILQHRNTCTL